MTNPHTHLVGRCENWFNIITVARVAERRDAYTVLVRKPEGKRPLGRIRRRWEDNIKIDHQEMGWGHGLDRSGS
jgi:hypothetical protein